MLIKNSALSGKHNPEGAATIDQSESGVTPDKPTCKIKYASARIKLLRVDTSQDAEGSAKIMGQDSVKAKLNVHSTAKTALTGSEQTGQIGNSAGIQGNDLPTNSSATSTQGGFKHMRRLVEMLINEFYRKRGKSIKTVARA